MTGRFWLTHHSPDEYARTVSLRGLRLCARCLGTYPVLLLAVAMQFALRAPLAWAGDGVLALGALVPALADWSVGRFHPEAGSNARRLLTGVLLGLALGRTLYIHVQQPLPLWLVLQGVASLAVVVPVLLLSRRARP